MVKAQAKLFSCPEPGCDMLQPGFPTEEARNAHIQEEHTRPNQDPMAFFHATLVPGNADGGHGTPKAKSGGQEPGLPSASAMIPSLSKQGQTPSSKPDLAATPMSRDASMRRQGSAAGAVKSEGTPKLADGKAAVSGDGWNDATLNPQDLSDFVALDDLMDDGMGDFAAWRSSTPNDTPESRDSGVSEPNSDVSEGANLEIGMSWQQFGDSDVIAELENFQMDGYLNLDGDRLGADYLNFAMHEEMDENLSKPFHFDTSNWMLDNTT